MDRSLLFPLLTPVGRRHGQDGSGMNHSPTLPSLRTPQTTRPVEAEPMMHDRRTGRRRQMPFFIRWWLALQN